MAAFDEKDAYLAILDTDGEVTDLDGYWKADTDTFYLYLNDMDVDYLDDHDYSREEILDGLKSLAEDWGVTGLEALV